MKLVRQLAHYRRLTGVDLSFSFGQGCGATGDWCAPDGIGMLISGEGICCHRGVYLFSSSAGEIVYIGRAGQKNSQNPVWDHIQRPTRLPSGRCTFPRHRFKSKAICPQLQQEFDEGLTTRGVIIVSHPHLAPMIELYLQTLHVERKAAYRR